MPLPIEIMKMCGGDAVVLPQVLWVGHESDSYYPLDSESASTFDAGYERTAIVFSDSPTPGSHPDYPATDEIFHRFNFTGQGGGGQSGGSTVVRWCNAAGTVLAKIIHTATNSGLVKLQIWNGSAFVDVGGTWGHSVGTKYTFHVHIKGGASGVAYVNSNGTDVVNTTGNYSSFTGIVRHFHQVTRTGFSISTRISHGIMATGSTLNMTSEVKPPTSDGNDTTGTGGFANVDELSNSDADLCVLTTGQQRSFKSAARTLTKTYPLAVVLTARAFFTTSGTFRPYLLIGGLRYYGTTFTAQAAARGWQYAWNLNPATGVAWTPTEVNDANLEYGWEGVSGTVNISKLNLAVVSTN